MQEADEYHCHIVPSQATQLEVGRQTPRHQLFANLLRVHTCNNNNNIIETCVDGLCESQCLLPVDHILLLTHGDSLPDEIDDRVVAKDIPDAVTGEYQELPVICDLAHFHVRVRCECGIGQSVMACKVLVEY